MDVQDLVARHYGSGDLTATILRALQEAGTDPEHLTSADLHPVDQLHAGGAAATALVLAALDLPAGAPLLDVGCGIGGPARLAAEGGARVTGIDLTPAFVRTATELTAAVGLAERLRFLTTSGESLPFEDGAFRGAMMVHVGMNLPDKRAVFTEVHRVLAPGSPFAVHDQMRVGAGDLTFPLPWAEDERSSFVESPEDYTRALEAAGFVVERVEDLTAATAGPPPPARISQAAVLGPTFVERVGHNIADTRAGRLGAVLVLARA